MYSSTLRADEGSPVSASPGGRRLLAISTSLVLLSPEQLAKPIQGTLGDTVLTLHTSLFKVMSTLSTTPPQITISAHAVMLISAYQGSRWRKKPLQQVFRLRKNRVFLKKTTSLKSFLRKVCITNISKRVFKYDFGVCLALLGSDWDERDEDGSDRQLWENNWDDDNVEDEFSCQLRYYLCVTRLCTWLSVLFT